MKKPRRDPTRRGLLLSTCATRTAAATNIELQADECERIVPPPVVILILRQEIGDFRHDADTAEHQVRTNAEVKCQLAVVLGQDVGGNSFIAVRVVLAFEAGAAQ